MDKAIYIYKRGTRLARIARLLEIPVQYRAEGAWTLLRKGRTAQLRCGINWGNTGNLPVTSAKDVLNYNVINAAKKVKAFALFDEKDIPCPEWSLSFEELLTKISSTRTIFARCDGLSGGKGIQIIPPENRRIWEQGGWPEKQETDFYVGRISYQREFRVHVWLGKVIITQAKFIPPGCENPIHNHDNGCKFSTTSIEKCITERQRSDMESLAIRAVAALSLDFGAVDLILSQKSKFYVLEINTAPGIRTDPVELAYRHVLGELIVGH